MTTRAVRLHVSILVLALLLCGCTVLPTVPIAYPDPVRASIATPHGEILIVQEGSGALAMVSPGTNMNFPLSGYLNASVVGAWQNGQDSTILVAGPTFNCPLRYEIVSIGPTNVEGTQLGTCGVEFAVQEQANGTIAGRQMGEANDPLIWSYQSRQLIGPELASAAAAERPYHPGDVASAPSETAPADAGAPSFPVLNQVGTSLLPQAVPVPADPQTSPPAVKLDSQ